jgi:hypothetical protein
VKLHDSFLKIYNIDMNELVIKVGWEFFFGIIGSLLVFAWYGSARFTRLESSFEDVKRRISNLEGKVFGLSGSMSPISLTEKGNKVLDISGLRKYIDNNIDILSENCKKSKDIQTAYDVQECAFAVFESISLDDDIEKSIKIAAYEEGIDKDIVRRVGGIYLRDKLLEKFGMQSKDVDGHK